MKPGPTGRAIMQFLETQAGREFTTLQAKAALPTIAWGSLRSRIHEMWLHKKLDRRPNLRGAKGQYLYRERKRNVDKVPLSRQKS